MNFKKTKLNSRRRKLKRQLSNQVSKISKSSKLTQLKEKAKKHLPKAILVFCAILIPLFVIVQAYNTLIDHSDGGSLTNRIIKSVGKNLPHDNQGYTNFLLLGTGTEDHGGKDLTDTIILASFNQKDKDVILTSIPRDLFYKHPDYYGQKINSLFATAYYANGELEEGYQAISEAVSEITNREIHRYIRINFDTLVDVVDAMGGITVNVEKAIYDTEYPTKNFGYQIFKLDVGLQNLDGETALKYVRSRHGVGSSDFDRSRRQQKVLFALKEKAQSSDLLSSPEQIKELYHVLEKGIDTNLELLEIIELASLASGFDKQDLTSIQLSNDPFAKGGLLYAPPRYLYNDIFVLRPLGESFNAIHFLLDLHYKYPQAMRETKTISVLNGTPSTGLAGETAQILRRFGLIIPDVDNARSKTIPKTTLYNRNPLVRSKLPDVINAIVPVKISNDIPEEYQITNIENDTDFVLELGQDFLPIFQQLSKNQYQPIAPPEPVDAETEPESNTTPGEQIDTNNVLNNNTTATETADSEITIPETTE